jgi:hypothetical protein
MSEKEKFQFYLYIYIESLHESLTTFAEENPGQSKQSEKVVCPSCLAVVLP